MINHALDLVALTSAFAVSTARGSDLVALSIIILVIAGLCRLIIKD